MNCISLKNVSKQFPRLGGQMLLRQRIGKLFSGPSANPFYALKNVSFDLIQGEGLGVIGSNGAGKSTLLGLIAGPIYPSSQTLPVQGTAAALPALGPPFHPHS